MRGTDTLTIAQVQALAAATSPATREKLRAHPELLKNVIRDTLVQHAVLAQAQAEKFADKPEVVAMLARVRETALMQAFLASKSQPPAGYPTEAELQAGYERAKSRLMQPRGYHLLQAFVPLAAGAKPAETEHARHVLGAVQAAMAHGRVTLEDAARKTAGVQIADLGWLPEAQLQPAARDAVAGLPEGQTAPPFCLASGCVLLKLVATRPAGPAPLGAVRGSLIELMREQKEKQGEQDYANQLLAKEPVRIDEIQLSHLDIGNPR